MDPLHVVTCISNPVRYRTRYDLYEKFAKHMADSGALLYTVEMAFGDRPFEITDPANPRHIQLRSSEELWHKENMLNVGFQRLPSDAEYVAWVDADIKFTRPDWAEETVQQLQHYPVVQMWSEALDLNPQFQPFQTHWSFVHEWYHNPKFKPFGTPGQRFGHPGYAWAARRDTIDGLGGLIDFAMLGAADHHMACALIGKIHQSYPSTVHPNYKALCLEWQDRCDRFIDGNIGYVAATIHHYWHGSKENRHYQSRWEIFAKNEFDPIADIYKDTQGLYQLKHDDRLLGLRDDIRRYFRCRHEDSTYTGKYDLLP